MSTPRIFAVLTRLGYDGPYDSDDVADALEELERTANQPELRIPLEAQPAIDRANDLLEDAGLPRMEEAFAYTDMIEQLCKVIIQQRSAPPLPFHLQDHQAEIVRHRDAIERHMQALTKVTIVADPSIRENEFRLLRDMDVSGLKLADYRLWIAGQGARPHPIQVSSLREPSEIVNLVSEFLKERQIIRRGSPQCSHEPVETGMRRSWCKHCNVDFVMRDGKWVRA